MITSAPLGVRAGGRPRDARATACMAIWEGERTLYIISTEPVWTVCCLLSGCLARECSEGILAAPYSQMSRARLRGETGLQGRLLPSQADSSVDGSKGSGLIASMANLANAAVGAGVLALPDAFKLSGLALGPVIAVIFAILLGYSLHVLGLASDYSRREHGAARSYQEIVHNVLGPTWCACPTPCYVPCYVPCPVIMRYAIQEPVR